MQPWGENGESIVYCVCLSYIFIKLLIVPIFKIEMLSENKGHISFAEYCLEADV